jgi:hypothetical protein
MNAAIPAQRCSASPKNVSVIQSDNRAAVQRVQEAGSRRRYAYAARRALGQARASRRGAQLGTTCSSC